MCGCADRCLRVWGRQRLGRIRDVERTNKRYQKAREGVRVPERIGGGEGGGERGRAVSGAGAEGCRGKEGGVGEREGPWQESGVQDGREPGAEVEKVTPYYLRGGL